MKLEDFKVGQTWETRNEKARGEIIAIADYPSDYPIKLAWRGALPDFVSERPVIKGSDDHTWDLFRADGGLNFAGPNPAESEWDLVRIVDLVLSKPEPSDEPEEMGMVNRLLLDLRNEWLTDMAYDFAKIGARLQPNLAATDITRFAFDLAEAFVAEQTKRGYQQS